MADTAVTDATKSNVERESNHEVDLNTDLSLPRFIDPFQLPDADLEAAVVDFAARSGSLTPQEAEFVVSLSDELAKRESCGQTYRDARAALTQVLSGSKLGLFERQELFKELPDTPEINQAILHALETASSTEIRKQIVSCLIQRSGETFAKMMFEVFSSHDSLPGEGLFISIFAKNQSEEMKIRLEDSLHGHTLLLAHRKIALLALTHYTEEKDEVFFDRIIRRGTSHPETRQAAYELLEDNDPERGLPLVRKLHSDGVGAEIGIDIKSRLPALEMDAEMHRNMREGMEREMFGDSSLEDAWEWEDENDSY